MVEKRTLAMPLALDVRPGRAHQLVLLPLHHERVGHLALEQVDVEHGDELAGDAVAEMEQGRDQSAAGVVGEDFVREAELGQHLDGGRMDGGGALILGRLGLAFQQGDRNALLDQCQRRHRPDGTGADHNHPIIMLHDQLRTSALYTPTRARRTSEPCGIAGLRPGGAALGTRLRNSQPVIRLWRSRTSRGETAPRPPPCGRSIPAHGRTGSAP